MYFVRFLTVILLAFVYIESIFLNKNKDLVHDASPGDFADEFALELTLRGRVEVVSGASHTNSSSYKGNRIFLWNKVTLLVAKS